MHESVPHYDFGKIDILDYYYGSGNRLTSITEGSNKDHGFKGDGGGIGYDANGNMTSVAYKGGGFDYNHLNLPYHFGSGANGSIDWLYDAAGTKLQKIVSVNGAPDDSYTKDYIHGIEYKDGVIEAIYHGDGRAVLTPDPDDETSLIYCYEYYVKDHLGNVRIVFSDKNNNGYLEPFAGTPQKDYSEVLQENHYYPFGMGMEGPWEQVTGDPKNNYTYNGKELNKDLGLDWADYGARMYDPSIGRWGQVDPLAEKFYGWSPYNYTYNNPILYVDPDGRGPIKRFIKKAVKNTIKRGGKIDFKADFVDTFSDYADAVKEFGDGNWGTDDLVMAFELVTDVEVSDIKAVKKWANRLLKGKGSTKKLGKSKKGDDGRSRKNGGNATEPDLPNKSIVNEDGVEVVHYTKSGDHGPPHMHVKGGGAETKIGQNGKPLDGSPELTSPQQKVVTNNKAAIRKAGKQIGKYNRYNNQ